MKRFQHQEYVNHNQNKLDNTDADERNTFQSIEIFLPTVMYLLCISIHTLVSKSLSVEDIGHDTFYRIVRMQVNDLRWHQAHDKFDIVDMIYIAIQHEHPANEQHQCKSHDNDRRRSNKSLNSIHHPIRNKCDSLCLPYLINVDSENHTQLTYG